MSVVACIYMAKLDWERPKYAWERKFRVSDDPKPYIADKNTVVWFAGNKRIGRIYIELYKVPPEKCGNLQKVFQVSGIIVRHNGYLEKSGFGFPVVQVLEVLPGKRLKVAFLTRDYKYRKSKVEEDDYNFAIQAIVHGLRIVKEYGWGYSELKQIE